MRRIDDGRGWGIRAVVALAACALILLPAAGGAITPCGTPPANLCDTNLNPSYATTDCDNDGLTDKEECEGFSTPATTPRPINGYAKTNDPTTAEKLDPSRPDLFFMVTDMNGKTVGPGSLMYGALLNGDPGTALNVYANGLKITTHRIDSANVGADRLVGSVAKAAWIRESTSTTADGTYLGKTPESKPTDVNVFSTIYTQKIKNNVDTNCPAGKGCSVKNTSITNGGGTNNTPIVNYYILQVTAHEMGHGSRLAPTDAASYYHYSKSGTIMDPSVSFSRGVYTIPTSYDPVKDPPAAALK